MVREAEQREAKIQQSLMLEQLKKCQANDMEAKVAAAIAEGRA